jgi:KRAB domain-containing zinc finger protein
MARCTLNLHVFIHAGKKPFTCEVYNREFTGKDHLKIYTCVHIGERPFKCEV